MHTGEDARDLRLNGDVRKGFNVSDRAQLQGDGLLLYRRNNHGNRLTLSSLGLIAASSCEQGYSGNYDKKTGFASGIAHEALSTVRWSEFRERRTTLPVLRGPLLDA